MSPRPVPSPVSVSGPGPFTFARFDIAAFLRDDWQRRPVLVRNPWHGWANPIDPDDLAGLACEDGVESRLVEQRGDGPALEQGPLDPERFGELGAHPWTVLVQGVDQHDPAVARLREPFGFLPAWRIDDVMVSYATNGGGVGAHYDQYDVFLIQGLGRRRWQVGARCDGETPLLPHPDLRLLAEFVPVDDWVLEPGDMLYVPAGWAHAGVAVGDDCMTYSVGLRAPSRRELVAGWVDAVLADLEEDDRYTDPRPLPREGAGEIGGETIARLHAMAIAPLADRAAFARWFGGHITRPRDPDIDWRPETPLPAADLRAALAQGGALLVNPAMRLAHISRDDGGVDLFVDGERFPCEGAAAALARQLCAAPQVRPAASMLASEDAMALLHRLIAAGALAPEDQADANR